MHRDTLSKKKFIFILIKEGRQIYKTNYTSDRYVNYFPTGNEFFEYETRLEIMRKSIKEANLSDKVEILSMPKKYAINGFYDIISKIKSLA